MANIVICAACLCRIGAHSFSEAASCCLRRPLSAADVHALRQSEVLKCIYSTIPPTVAFYHWPLADLAAGWIAFDNPQ